MPLEENIETCSNKLKSYEAARKLGIQATEDLLRYDKMGCYSCGGKDKEMDCYKE